LWHERVQTIFTGALAGWRRKEFRMAPDILEHLRAIRATQDRHSEDLREIKGRLGILESQYASLSNRLDRMDERVARIEKRLDLVEG
jgi:predicted  nucleic acid-binding Zn-ribbon protein